MPGFTLRTISYEFNAEVDTQTGAITEADYLPGKQNAWFATVTAFFTLHFGSFGGAPVRWAYFALGLAGTFLFYTGNLLWIESRRRKERKAGAVEQTRATRILGALTVGVPLGCVAGISLTVAAAKWLPAGASDLAAWHSRIYYLVFVAAIFWALARGAARSGAPLLWAAAAATAAIPISSLLSTVLGSGWSHDGASRLVDLVAVAGAAALGIGARAVRRRAVSGPRDSIWSVSQATRSAQVAS